MKISTLLVGATFAFFVASCGESKVQEGEKTPAATEVPAPPAASAPEGNSTEINVSTDGGKIQTKDGQNETKVEVKKDKVEIEIKK